LEETRASCEELGRLLALLPNDAVVIWFLEASIFHIALCWKFSWTFFMSFVQPEVAYFHNHPPQLTLLKVMAQGATNEKLWREQNVCCF
jgi:hypothetical protein